MTGLVTNHFRVHNAAQFLEQFGEAAPTVMYLFIARMIPWTDDVNPPTPGDTVNYMDYEIWKHIMGFKKVTSSDVSHCVPRYNWESGTIYGQWSHIDTAIYSDDYFVLTEDYRVYKCLSNNRGATSTVKPTGTSTSSFTTADGYIWKFLYEISASEAIKFLTSSYMPVKTLTANNGSTQWDVQQAAANGAIEAVHVTAVGSLYRFHSDTAQSGNSSAIILATGAASNNGYYTNNSVYISSGTGSGQLRRIVGYNGTTKAAYVSPAFSPSPNGTSVYKVSPRINVSGDGVNFSAYTSGSVSSGTGTVTGVTILNAGQSYGRANGQILGNTAGGGATIVPVLSPRFGHGKDPVEELGGRNVMINVKLTGSESGTLTTNNDFRIIGLINDPLTSGGSAASASLYNQMTTINNLASLSGTFQKDEIVRGGTSGAIGYVVSVSARVMTISSVKGRFQTAETLTGNTSGATATANGVTQPALKPFTGRIIFVDQRAPITRSSTQTEDLKLVIRF